MFLSWCCIYSFVFRSYPAQRKRKNEEFTFSKDKRSSSTVTVLLQMKKLYAIEIHRR